MATAMTTVDILRLRWQRREWERRRDDAQQWLSTFYAIWRPDDGKLASWHLLNPEQMGRVVDVIAVWGNAVRQIAWLIEREREARRAA